MKRIFLIGAIVAMATIVFAQTPQAFNYQAVLRNNDGSVKADETIAIQISLIDDAGTSVYIEIHNTQTNQLGLVNVVIGQGTSSNDLALVDWSTGPYYLDITINGEHMGSSPILSVPYALYALYSAQSSDVDILKVQIEELQILNGLRVKDADGNLYKTIQIGDQVWMAENLKATKYADDVAIPLVTDDITWGALNFNDKAYCYYNNSDSLSEIYGALYTWTAAMDGAQSNNGNPSGVQGVCPDGWHLPSDAEWKQLEIYLGMSQTQADSALLRGTFEGGKLKETGTVHWEGPNEGATNESGFTAFPGGYRYYEGNFTSIGYYSYWWSSTESSTDGPWFRVLGHNYSSIYRANFHYNWGLSVRCVKDL